MHSSIILSNLNKQRQEKEFCDVILKVQDQKFFAHRNVLAASSEYFRKIFTINIRENYENELTIKDISANVMTALLNYIYTGTLDLTEQNTIDVFHAAASMFLKSAMEYMVDYLIDSIDIDNCLFIHRIGVDHSVENLTSITSKFIAENIEEIVVQDAYLDSSADELELVLESDNLNVKEEAHVYEFILRWTNKNAISRKHHFYKLFSRIRLQHVPLRYAISVIRRNEFVREFPDCRDLIEDVLFFRINPELIPVEYPRTCHVLNPDSLMLVSSPQTNQRILRFSENNFSTQKFESWTPNFVTKDSAVAIKQPFATFCGGLDANNTVLDSVVQFDGRCWNRLPSLNTPRCGCTAVYYKKDLFVFGGEKSPIPPNQCFVDKENESNPRKETDFADDFEMLNKNWITVGKLPKSRSYATASVVKEKIYLMGGYLLTNTPEDQEFFSGSKLNCKEASNSTDIYNVRKKSWEKGPPMNVARAGAGSVVVNSTIFVFGGLGINSSSVLVAELLNVPNGVWTSIVNASPSHTHMTKVCWVNDLIYVVGSANGKFLSYDPRFRKWVSVANNSNDVGAFIIPFSQTYYENFNKKN